MLGWGKDPTLDNTYVLGLSLLKHVQTERHNLHLAGNQENVLLLLALHF